MHIVLSVRAVERATSAGLPTRSPSVIIQRLLRVPRRKSVCCPTLSANFSASSVHTRIFGQQIQGRKFTGLTSIIPLSVDKKVIECGFVQGAGALASISRDLRR